MIAFHQLSLGYASHHHHAAVEVARQLSARLNPGELTCLVGHNGVGKSTLLRTLAGVQPPMSGQVDWGGHDFHKFSMQQRARLVSVVLTERPVDDGLRVEELVGMGRYPYTGFAGRLGAADCRIVTESMRAVGVDHMAQRRLYTLSDGERQKVMIAKSLAQQTPVILLDEPTAFLDFSTKPLIFGLLSSLAHDEGKSILLSTHDVEMAMQVADQLWLMHDGALTVGTPRQLAESGLIAQCFASPLVQFDAETLHFTLAKK